MLSARAGKPGTSCSKLKSCYSKNMARGAGTASEILYGDVPAREAREIQQPITSQSRREEIDGVTHFFDDDGALYQIFVPRHISYSRDQFSVGNAYHDAVIYIKDDKVHRDPDEGAAVEYANGAREYYQSGVLHREDGPAWTHPKGTEMWFLNGKKHRAGGPAESNADGTMEWYQSGVLHRADGPAVEHPDGSKEWRFYGHLHREDGPAVEKITPEGIRCEWHIDGRLQREDGPAIVEPDGTEEWYYYGGRHRPHGPAVVRADGSMEWHRHGHLHRLDGPASVGPPGLPPNRIYALDGQTFNIEKDWERAKANWPINWPGDK